VRTDADLAQTVARALGTRVERVEDVTRHELAYDAFLAGRSLSLLSGRAITANGDRPWSLVEKVTEGPSIASAYLYDNGLREFRAYRSGLLRDLAPGVVAPQVHGLVEEADGRLVLWLEDVGAVGRPRLHADDLLRVARHLGRLGGRWLGRAPAAPWLFSGWIDRHGQPEAVAPALELLRSLRDRRAVEARLGRSVEEVAALIGAQSAYRATLESLPTTLCHHDAVAANVFGRRRGAAHETVLIDWESVGPGAIGADLASLLFSSPRRGDVPTAIVLAIVDRAVEEYRAGFADVGARVEPDAVRRGFDAAVALRWKLARDVVEVIDGGGTIFRGSAMHETPEEALDELVRLTALLFASADAARA
jgi:hypothetical protein